MDGATFLLHMSAILEIESMPWTMRLSASCGRVRFPPHWQSGEAWWRSLHDFDLWFVWAGRGHMRIDHEEIPLSAGTCVWKRPGRRYVTHHDPLLPLGVNFFHFDLLGATGDEQIKRLAPPVEVMQVHHNIFTDQVMQRIIQLREEPDGLASANRLFAALLAEMIREAKNRTRPKASVRPDHIERIHALTLAIQTDPARDASVATLARESGYSVSHFSRLFASITGKRPQQYVMDSRLDKARELLAVTSAPIGEIALASGFSEIYYFSRAFKQHVGNSPSDYRRNLNQG